MTIKNVKEERKDASAKSSHHLVAFKVIKKRKKKRIHRVALHVENNERVSFYCTAQIWRIVNYSAGCFKVGPKIYISF